VANRKQNELFWSSWALERVVLGQPGSRTTGSGLGQPGSRTGGSGGLRVSGRVGMQRAGSRTGGSGIGTGASAPWNKKFWRERALERVVLGQPGSRTRGFRGSHEIVEDLKRKAS